MMATARNIAPPSWTGWSIERRSGHSDGYECLRGNKRKIDTTPDLQACALGKLFRCADVAKSQEPRKKRSGQEGFSTWNPTRRTSGRSTTKNGRRSSRTCRTNRARSVTKRRPAATRLQPAPRATSVRRGTGTTSARSTTKWFHGRREASFRRIDHEEEDAGQEPLR